MQIPFTEVIVLSLLMGLVLPWVGWSIVGCRELSGGSLLPWSACMGQFLLSLEQCPKENLSVLEKGE